MKVLKFGATWCPGCVVMKPRWKEVETEHPWLETEYYDYDTDKEAVEKHSVNDVLPTFVFLDTEGNEILRMHGEVEKEKIVKAITENRNR